MVDQLDQLMAVLFGKFSKSSCKSQSNKSMTQHHTFKSSEIFKRRDQANGSIVFPKGVEQDTFEKIMLKEFHFADRYKFPMSIDVIAYCCRTAFTSESITSLECFQISTKYGVHMKSVVIFFNYLAELIKNDNIIAIYSGETSQVYPLDASKINLKEIIKDAIYLDEEYALFYVKNTVLVLWRLKNIKSNQKYYDYLTKIVNGDDVGSTVLKYGIDEALIRAINFCIYSNHLRGGTIIDFVICSGYGNGNVENVINAGLETRIALVPNQSQDPKSRSHSYISKPTIEAKRRCGYCGVHAISQCSQCKSVVYCSQRCQKVDWEKHKLNCQKK